MAASEHHRSVVVSLTAADAEKMATEKRIIVLDDGPSALAAVKRLLKAYGFEAEAFETVRAFRDRARLEDASCLVLDINLDGQCGIELRKQLAAERISIPVIFVTAGRQGINQASCLASRLCRVPAKAISGARFDQGNRAGHVTCWLP